VEQRPKHQYTGPAKAALEKVMKISADDPAVVKRATELLKQMDAEK
jgi:hypothetical protein